jgi:hypothetical protein
VRSCTLSRACSRVIRALFVRRRLSFARSAVRLVRVSRVSFASWCVVSCIVNLSRLESPVLIILVIYLTAASVAD